MKNLAPASTTLVAINSSTHYLQEYKPLLTSVSAAKICPNLQYRDKFKAEIHVTAR